MRDFAGRPNQRKPMKINESHQSFVSGSALSSVVEHFLHTEMPGKEQSVEPHAESERVTVRTEFCP